MEKVVRAFPISSREALLEMADQVASYTSEHKRAFFDNFGDATEDWFYQEIEGKPYVICVAQGDNLEAGYANYEQLNDEFSVWFKDKVAELSGVDVNKTPKGPETNHVFCFNNR